MHCSPIGNVLSEIMRLIAFGNLRAYVERFPETEPPIYRWRNLINAASFASMSDVQAAFSKAKILNAERVRFEISGGQHRLIVAFDFEKQIAFVKFIGTHSEYDAVDAFTIAMF